MTSQSLIVIALVAVAVVVVAILLKRRPRPFVNKVSAVVTVRPESYQPASGEVCGDPANGNKVCVTPEPIVTPGTQGEDVTVQWQANNCRFDRNNGIKIHPMARWRFTTQSESEFVAVNKKGNGTERYKYDIEVTDANGTRQHIDPTIMN